MNKTKLLVCVLLILPLAGSAPETAKRPGGETPDDCTTQRQIQICAKSFAAGHYREAISCFEASRERAVAAGERARAARALSNEGSCYFALRQYQPALERLMRARLMAEAAGDPNSAGGIAANISSVYEQMGELDAAVAWAERGLPQLTSRKGARHRPRVLIHMASLRARQGRMDDAVGLFARGIRDADAAGDRDTYSIGWDRLGEEYYKHGQLAWAEEAMLEAYRIRKLNRLAALETSYRNLGRIRLAQGDMRSAEALLDRAAAPAAQRAGRMPMWDVYHTRAMVRLAQNRLPEALTDLRATLSSVRAWRARVAPADGTRLSSEQLLEQAYASLVRASSLLYLKTRSAALLRESFEAAEENRAFSLRALREDGATAAPVGDLLVRTERRLGPERAYLGFQLGEPESWMWAVDQGGATLSRLPGRAAIRRATAEFLDRMDPAAGARLYRMLFGSLPHRIRVRPHWLLALDEQLFAIPFAALPADGQRWLVEKHSVQVVSGAGLLTGLVGRGWPERLAGGFVGVGDPIYNLADARWNGPSRRAYLPSFQVLAGSEGEAAYLPRLVGSGREIELCAGIWGGPGGILLEGGQASREGLRQALATRPAVIHLATHVLRSRQRTRHGLIALSLRERGNLDLLDPAEIQDWGLDAGLVVLSGCSSGIAAALPGSGLMGLTRAWLAVGAGGVVASLWPTPDDHGAVFRRLYDHLKREPAAGPAVALARAQRDMLASPDRQAQPRYWGAYFLMANQ